MKKFFLIFLFITFSVSAMAQDDDSDNVITQVCVPVDNCPNVFNPMQGDCDSDGVGDLCDDIHGCIGTDPVDTDTGIDTETAENDTGEALPSGCSRVPGGEGVFSDVDTDFIERVSNSGHIRDPNVFMIIGDSHSARPVWTSYPENYFMGNCSYPWGDASEFPNAGIKDLQCFPDLENSIDAFSFGNAGGVSPFLRYSLTAVGGKPSSWLVENPSIQQDEIDAINPQFAVIMFGTNDAASLTIDDIAGIQAVVDNLITIADYSVEQGVIPIIKSPPVRIDRMDVMAEIADRLRVACAIKKYPFVDFHAVTESLPDYGLRPDGSVHLSAAYWKGKCIFDTLHIYGDLSIGKASSGEAADHLVTSVMLDRVFDVVVSLTQQ